MSKTKWVIDPTHSEVTFKVKHMMISSVSGHFTKYNGSVETNGSDFKDSTIKVEIDVDSISTKNEDRDNHLKSDDFFNAESFPTISFSSKSFNGSKLVGDLTIRDVTKEITLNVDFNGIATDPYGQTKAGMEVTGEINRKDYGLSWSAVTEAGNVVVSDKVKLIVEAQFIKQ
ncbi:polyisoprenoid-binding protein YceI [Saonia flava]|uniref:Polyisoprenoid-binding protein YceI n=1 Tax=Saonia flava TaxID=523696 RepID=A0A846QXY5_9FLAO|nr:YceI family protein [Saonia flava]NJB70495.1 polyisoprenoid-binding protein YceI [Saonia flava]